MDFGKLDEHSKINAQGTGLGLSICKKMIERMGGTVSVMSEVGVGTTFTVSLVMQAKTLNHEQNNLSQQIIVEEEEMKENSSVLSIL
jgi:K+-sensing histidine kinase KdpD